MSAKVELNEATLDKYDVLRSTIRAKWPGFVLEDFRINQDGTVSVRIEKTTRKIGSRYQSQHESRYINAKWGDRKQSWKLTGDIQ